MFVICFVFSNAEFAGQRPRFRRRVDELHRSEPQTIQSVFSGADKRHHDHSQPTMMERITGSPEEAKSISKSKVRVVKIGGDESATVSAWSVARDSYMIIILYDKS